MPTVVPREGVSLKPDMPTVVTREDVCWKPGCEREAVKKMQGKPCCSIHNMSQTGNEKIENAKKIKHIPIVKGEDVKKIKEKKCIPDVKKEKTECIPGIKEEIDNVSLKSISGTATKEDIPINTSIKSEKSGSDTNLLHDSIFKVRPLSGVKRGRKRCDSAMNKYSKPSGQDYECISNEGDVPDEEVSTDIPHSEIPVKEETCIPDLSKEVKSPTIGVSEETCTTGSYVNKDKIKVSMPSIHVNKNEGSDDDYESEYDEEEKEKKEFQRRFVHVKRITPGKFDDLKKLNQEQEDKLVASVAANLGFSEYIVKNFIANKKKDNIRH